MKIRTITVSYPHVNPDVVAGYRFRVERVTDSVEFVPHQFLSKREVDELCAANGWKVTTIHAGEPAMSAAGHK